MGPTNFDDPLKFLDFLIHFLLQFIQGRQQTLIDFRDGGNMDNRRETIITGLATIDMIVGMDCLIFDLPAQDEFGSVGDDFVGVHVGLRARACLPDYQREVVVQFSFGYLVCCLDYCVCYSLVEAVLDVYLCRAFLY